MAGSTFKYERLDKTDSVLVILDMQEGLFGLCRDYDAVQYRNAMFAHAALGKVFGLPVVITSSADTGANGPIPNEILKLYPEVSVVKRQGEVNAWDNPEFRAAIKATKKSQVIMAGIVTDVCTAFCALSLREAGYSVWANHEASGTTSVEAREQANNRMRDAGVQIVSYFAVVCELMRDWRNTPGSLEILPLLDQYYPAYGMVARAHLGAIKNGQIQPGEEQLP
ncbi:Isochorismatase hydrolase [Xylaria intraflava]|nr:Isochorismatase hydrolase [Xylaria intraflava]